MLKVLIADDEKKVCQLIANLVDWEELGFEVVGVVYDGASAYKFIQRNTVDVMITDIRMPECDGLELIRKVKLLFPDLYIVIISGYSQFDYAQNAIKYGVSDYLLKPIRKKDLVATLQKALQQCEKKISDIQYVEKLEKKLEENEERVKQSLLEDIMKRPEKFGGYYIREKINEEYHYQFTDGCYQAMIVKIILDKNRDSVDTRRIILQKGIESFQNGLYDSCSEMVLCAIDGEICGLFNGSLESLEQVKRKIKKVKRELLQLKEIFGPVQVHIALGNPKDTIALLDQSFAEARECLQDRFYYGDSFFLSVREPEGTADNVENYIDNEFKKRFLSHLEILDLESIQKEIDDIQTKLEHSRSRQGKVVPEVYKAIAALFYFGINSYNISIFDQYEELMAHLEVCGTIQEAMSYLKNYIIRALRQWLEEKQYEEAKPIRMAKQYINNHYREPLTLEMVSREIGFNPTYFSVVFKKETGFNFSEYLKKIRIENAKTFLLDTESSVEDISYEVGYRDIKYFSKLFKKLTGITPTEFRKLYK